MAEFRKQKRVRRLLYSPAVLAGLFALLLFVLHAAWNAGETYLNTSESKAAAVRQFESLKERSARVESDIARLETKEGVEEEIRNKFGFVKEGEGVVVIVEPPPASPESASSEEGFFRGVWDALVSIFE